MMEKYKEAYKNNKDCKDYTDKYATIHHLTVDEALEHLMVKNAIDYILSKGE